MSRKKTRFEDGSASARQDTQSDDRDGQLLPILTSRYGLERVQRAVQERICPKVHIKRWIRLAFSFR